MSSFSLLLLLTASLPLLPLLPLLPPLLPPLTPEFAVQNRALMKQRLKCKQNGLLSGS
jgi:hypothetical protein